LLYKGFIRVNNIIVNNGNYFLKPGDVVSINLRGLKKLRGLPFSFMMFKK